MSLLDMLQVHAVQYVRLGQLIHEHGGRLFMAEAMGDDPGTPLRDEEVHALKAHFAELAGLCDELGLTASKRSMERATAEPPKSSGEYRLLVSFVMDELENRLFLFVPAERASYFDQAADVPNMPSAGRELVRAGNCYAVAEYTAAVFHAMRAVEVGLEAVYLCLGQTPPAPTERSWGNLCNGIKGELAKRPKGWPEQDRFSAIHATLVSVKDAWRNNTMHVEIAYDEAQAKMILANVKAFVQVLASRMNEQGQPPA